MMESTFSFTAMLLYYYHSKFIIGGILEKIHDWMMFWGTQIIVEHIHLQHNEKNLKQWEFLHILYFAFMRKG